MINKNHITFLSKKDKTLKKIIEQNKKPQISKSKDLDEIEINIKANTKSKENSTKKINENEEIKPKSVLFKSKKLSIGIINKLQTYSKPAKLFVRIEVIIIKIKLF